MMRVVRFHVVFLLALTLTGCINSSTLIKVKPDGSGTIEQAVLMNMAAMKGMLAGLDPKGEMQQKSPFNEEEMRRTAEKLGKGVRFVSATPLSVNGFQGTKAIYAFDDINQVAIDQDPNISGSTSGQMSMPPKNSNPVRFSFKRQPTGSVLTVSFDEKATAGQAPPQPPAEMPQPDPAMMAIMKSMFQGFKVAIDLEVEGKITKTNADYVNGSRITLLEIDMASLLDDEAKLRALQSKVGPGASIAEIKPLLKDVKGVKINHPVVTVEYR